MKHVYASCCKQFVSCIDRFAISPTAAMGASKKQPPAKPAAMKAKAQPKKTLQKPKIEPASPAKLKNKTPDEEGEGVSRRQVSSFLTGLKYKAENSKDKACATAQALLEAEIFKKIGNV